jgi:endonuclease/exonuclease/phosphatase (EEP) superfamily protein YafD
MLADSLADSFPNLEPQYLTWQHRKPLILSIIQERFPDIIVLQECDKFDEINEALKANYQGMFAQKQKEHLDGVAIFVRKSIKIIRSYKLKFSNGSQVACVAHLSLDNKHFVLAGVHLKSSEFENKKTLSNEEVKVHVMDLYKDLDRLKMPFIVSGDFNEEPGKSATSFMDSVATSAYAGMPHHYTTYKKRTEMIKYQAIDHIYASKDFKLYSVLPVQKIEDPHHTNPSATKIEFLPNANYPSDHVYLYAEYIF